MEGGRGGERDRVRSRLLLMLRGTRWLAEFQRRVGKDGGSGKSGGGGGGVEALRCGGKTRLTLTPWVCPQRDNVSQRRERTDASIVHFN